MDRINRWNDFRRWIHKEGFELKKGDGRKKSEVTHLLLNGGSLIVPDSRNTEFLTHYAHAVFDGDWVYVVEKKTLPVFYWSVELDIKIEGREVTREEIDRIVRTMQGVMKVAYPNKDITVIVCNVAPKTCSSEGEAVPIIQSGLHLLWRIATTLDLAWELRAWSLRVLQRELADMPLVGNWNDAFDDCIFFQNGLRLIGSRKAIPCTTCRGECFKMNTNGSGWGDQPCATCQNAGRLDKGRPYNVLYAADANGVVDAALTERLKSDILEAVRRTSFRAIDSTGLAIMEPDPINYGSEQWHTIVSEYAAELKKKRKKGQQKKQAKLPDQSADSQQQHKDNIVEVPPTDPAFPAVAEYIKAEFNGLPDLTNLKRNGKHTFYIANSNCRYCINKGGYHNHSSVFFIIKPNGCVQRCFCPKDDIQPGGSVKCINFVSKEHDLPEALSTVLFPKALLKRKKQAESRERIANILLPDRHPTDGDATELQEQTPLDPEPTPLRTPKQMRRSDPRSVMSVKPNGVREYDYQASKRVIQPKFTPMDFIKGLENASFKVI